MKIAVISAILENPKQTQGGFNEIVAGFRGIVKGRMGIPFEKEGIAVVSITVTADMDEINNFTGKLGKLDGVTVKATVSKNEYEL